MVGSYAVAVGAAGLVLAGFQIWVGINGIQQADAKAQVVRDMTAAIIESRCLPEFTDMANMPTVKQKDWFGNEDLVGQMKLKLWVQGVDRCNEARAEGVVSIQAAEAEKIAKRAAIPAVLGQAAVVAGSVALGPAVGMVQNAVEALGGVVLNGVAGAGALQRAADGLVGWARGQVRGQAAIAAPATGRFRSSAEPTPAPSAAPLLDVAVPSAAPAFDPFSVRNRRNAGNSFASPRPSPPGQGGRRRATKGRTTKRRRTFRARKTRRFVY